MENGKKGHHYHQWKQKWIDKKIRDGFFSRRFSRMEGSILDQKTKKLEVNPSVLLKPTNFRTVLCLPKCF